MKPISEPYVHTVYALPSLIDVSISSLVFSKSQNGRRRTLDVNDVADAIVTELRRAHRTRRVVVLPAIFYLMPLYQLLPMSIKVYMCCCSGQRQCHAINSSAWMKEDSALGFGLMADNDFMHACCRPCLPISLARTWRWKRFVEPTAS